MIATPAGAALAFGAGYAVGALPIAWLLVRRERGIDLRQRGAGGTGAIDALVVAGPATACLALLVECLKGAAVGLAATLVSPAGWFVASAIAGCVAGDTFPVSFRRGGRGLIPLVSGLLVALPVAGILCGVIALPVALLTRMRGSVFDVSVTISVPLGLVLGTRDWRSLAPAAAMVATMVARSRLRQQAGVRAPLMHRGGGTIVDQPSPSNREP